MKKAMLSQPMAGKTEQEIVETRERAIKVLTEKGFSVVNTLFTDEWYSKEKMTERGVENVPLCFLAKSLENMSLCHAAYFCRGWEQARGCRIEHDAAVAYGMEILYEAEPEAGGMTAEREAKILEGAVETFGAEEQVIVAIEECSELQKALTKWLRYKGKDGLTDEILVENIREEMADVSIMLNQLALIFGDANEEEIAKLERLGRRLFENE